MSHPSTADATVTATAGTAASGRPPHRTLHFNTFAEAMAEAETIIRAGEVDVDTVRHTGHFTAAQNLEHLARVLDVVNGDLVGPKVPLPIRWIGRLVRGRAINRPMKPGYKLPSSVQDLFWPTEAFSFTSAAEHLRAAAAKFAAATELPPHPIFGAMSRHEHERLQCRHFELHLGFIVVDPS